MSTETVSATAKRRRSRRTTTEEFEEVEEVRHSDAPFIAMAGYDSGDDFEGTVSVGRSSYLPMSTAFGFCLGAYCPTYLLAPVVRTGTLFGLTAGTGTGKTGFLLSAALAVATGRSDILGMAAKPGRVVFVSIENPEEARARLIVSARYFGVQLEKLDDRFIVIDVRCSPEALFTTLNAVASRQRPISLIAIDGFSAMFDGRDLNSGTETGNFLRRLRPLTKMRGEPAVLIAMHPGKNAGDLDLLPTGSGMLLNELDANLVLRRNAAAKSIQLHWAGKIRGLDFSPIDFGFELATSSRVRDSDGNPIPLPVLRPHKPPAAEALLIADASRGSARNLLLKAMLKASGGPQRDWAAAVGCSQTMVGKHLAALAREGMAEAAKGRWKLTAAGMLEAEK